jgi:hypothetical protein
MTDNNIIGTDRRQPSELRKDQAEREQREELPTSLQAMSSSGLCRATREPLPICSEISHPIP